MSHEDRPFRKAYNMVQWEFVKDMLKRYDFPDKFVFLIMECVTTTNFSIKINGEGCGFFRGKRGLRQDDPLSSLLFVLAMEYFFRIMRRMSRLPDFRYHPMCKGQELTHFTFADDVMNFCKENEQFVQRVMEDIGYFSATTGLTANQWRSQDIH